MRGILDRLAAIFEWNMNTSEAEVFKIALAWEREIDKQTPPHLKDAEWFRRNHLPRLGDPRKCHLFKQCWKLRRQTRGLLKEEEYPLYITANLMVLQHYNGYMGINTICGDKAWIRWKVWKRHFDKKMAQINNSPPPPITDSIVARELLRTKRLIYEHCEGAPTKEKIQTLIEKGQFKLWILQGKVSMYYVVLSPYVLDDVQRLAAECSFDPELFREKATAETVAYFRYEFGNEFDDPATTM